MGLPTPEDTDVDPDRLPTPGPGTSATPERAMADGSGEVSEERATPVDKGDGPEEDETDEDANTCISRRLRYAQLNRGRGRWNG